jgi:DNA repair exonuclease SbcCD ATPase subunit
MEQHKMSQQDVWDAEDAEMHRIFAEKDAEIERLKAELAHAEENLHKAGVRLGVLSVQLGNRDNLIGELADALSHYALLNDFEKSLLQRAKEATGLVT